MLNLKDLLQHEIQDLYSAEQQIIDALPEMIEKAGNSELKKGLGDHLEVTKEQKARLDRIMELLDMSEKKAMNNSFFSALFGNQEGEAHCRGMEGLIKEGKKMMQTNMAPEVMDAAIIACAQKIEHYEISGYGTARAYASELELAEVENLLSRTLYEEYDADDLLTSLAVGKLNEEAIEAEASVEQNADPIPEPEQAGPAAPAGGSKRSTRTKKAAPVKKAPVSKKAATAKKGTAPVKKAVVSKKAGTAKKAVPVKKKAAPGKKVSAPKKGSPVKKTAGKTGKTVAQKKAAPLKKKAPVKKAAAPVKKTASKKASVKKAAVTGRKKTTTRGRR